MIVSLKCGQCKFLFGAEVGTPKMNRNGSLIWEHKTVCPNCKAVDKDLLTELGQSQMTQFFFGDFFK
jgi:rubredoxin